MPAAIATGKNHIGTIAGKLNGLMMPTTPSGWRMLLTSTPVETSGVAALEQVRDAARELDDLLAARDLAECVRVHLAVLAGDDPGQLTPLAFVEQLAEPEDHLGAR